jgi:inward rectifier potassium channel
VQGTDKWYNHWRDPYHLMLTLPWVDFFAILSLLYAGINMGFASLYLLGGDGIVNAKSGSFADAFFFSVQTIASIGYGVLSPKTTYANILVVIALFPSHCQGDV